MTPEFSVEQIRDFVAKGFTSVAARVVKSAMQHYTNARLQCYTHDATLLEKYSLFLEKNGYMDVDWRAEEPLAIDEFLKSYPDNVYTEREHSQHLNTLLEMARQMKREQEANPGARDDRHYGVIQGIDRIVGLIERYIANSQVVQ